MNRFSEVIKGVGQSVSDWQARENAKFFEQQRMQNVEANVLPILVETFRDSQSKTRGRVPYIKILAVPNNRVAFLLLSINGIPGLTWTDVEDTFFSCADPLGCVIRRNQNDERTKRLPPNIRQYSMRW